MSRKSNNKGEIIHLIMKWRRKKNWNTMHSLVFHIGKEWYFIMWMSTSACYTMRWVTNAIITVSLCITCLQLSFPSHTHWAQLHWTDLNCISIGSHEQRYQHGAHRLRFYSGKVKQLILNVWIIVIMLSAPSYAWISYPSKAQQTAEKKSHSKHSGEEISFSLRSHTSMDDICCDATASVCVCCFQPNNIV